MRQFECVYSYFIVAWNIFLQEFLEPMNDLIKNLENMAQTDEGKQLIVVMDFLSKNNWPDIYDQITLNNDLNER